MKKILCLSLAVALVMVCGVALADGRVGQTVLTSRQIVNNATYGHTHVCVGPASIYRISFSSTEANTYVQVFDSNTTGQFSTVREEISAMAAGAYKAHGGTQFVKADIGEATANENKVVEYEVPLRCENGILIGFAGDPSTGGIDTLAEGTTANCIIEFRQD